MRIVTDSKTVEDRKDPDACNVFALYKLFASESECRVMAERYRAGGLGYGDVKKALLDLMWTYFEPFRKRRAELEKEPERIERIFQQGAVRARQVMRGTLKAARAACGLD